MSPRPVGPIVDAAVAEYAAEHSTAPSDELRAIDTATRAWSSRHEMMIDANEARLLSILVGVSGARRILEVGTFSGFSAAAMLEALPHDGRIDTLELDPEHARTARDHLDQLSGSDRVVIHAGPALDSLAALDGPYDLAFIDADKEAYPDYYSAVLALMRPGGLIVADNVLRAGRVLDAQAADRETVAMRRFNDLAASDARVETVLLTIRDGVSLIRVR